MQFKSVIIFSLSGEFIIGILALLLLVKELLSLPILLVFNIVLWILIIIASITSRRKKEEKKSFPFAENIGRWF